MVSSITERKCVVLSRMRPRALCSLGCGKGCAGSPGAEKSWRTTERVGEKWGARKRHAEQPSGWRRLEATIGKVKNKGMEAEAFTTAFLAGSTQSLDSTQSVGLLGSLLWSLFPAPTARVPSALPALPTPRPHCLLMSASQTRPWGTEAQTLLFIKKKKKENNNLSPTPSTVTDA